MSHVIERVSGRDGGRTSAWLWNVRSSDAPGAPTLVLLPHSGASAQAYGGWAERVPDGVRLLAAQYPGRGARYNEPFARSLHELADELADVLESIEAPLHLFGHSLGGVLAFEIAWRLERRGRVPATVFASAATAPNLIVPSAKPIHRLEREQLIQVLAERGGLPDTLLEHTELLDMMLDVVRADFALLDAYAYGAETRRLTCPLVVLGGDADPAVPVAALRAWSALGSGPVSVRTYRGGHFYLNAEAASVAASLRAHLTPASDRR